MKNRQETTAQLLASSLAYSLPR